MQSDFSDSQAPAYVFVLAEVFFLFCFCLDLEYGSEPALLSQLLQDEDVSDCGRHPHELRRDPQHLQLHASSTRSRPEGTVLFVKRL